MSDKRKILETLAKQEIHGTRESPFVPKCAICRTLLKMIGRHSDNYQGGAITPIEDPKLSRQSVEDLKQNYPTDHLSTGKSILYQFLDQEGIPDTPIDNYDPLEASGMHIVNIAEDGISEELYGHAVFD